MLNIRQRTLKGKFQFFFWFLLGPADGCQSCWVSRVKWSVLTAFRVRFSAGFLGLFYAINSAILFSSRLKKKTRAGCWSIPNAFPLWRSLLYRPHASSAVTRVFPCPQLPVPEFRLTWVSPVVCANESVETWILRCLPILLLFFCEMLLSSLWKTSVWFLSERNNSL